MNDCVFCKIVRGEEKAWKVLENNTALAFLDMRPVAAYHTLVIPKNHYVNMFDVPENVLSDTMALLRQVVHLYQEKLDINNLQLFNNSGKAANQSVFHLHFHIIPRFDGDNRHFQIEFHPELVEMYDLMLSKLQ